MPMPYEADDVQVIEPVDDEEESKMIKPIYDFRRIFKKLPTLATTDEAKAKRLLLGSHERMWHCPVMDFKNVLSRCGMPPEVLQLAKTTVSACAVCCRFTRATRRPQVKSSLARDFNEVIQIDSFQYRSSLFICIVDEAARYKVAGQLKSRELSSFLDAVMQLWFRHFGPCRRIVCDQEGSLMSQEAAPEFDRLGIERVPMGTTSGAAGKKHTGTGMVERHIGLLKMTMSKCSTEAARFSITPELEELAAEAAMAHNMTLNIGGYSPAMMVFGILPRGYLDVEDVPLSVASADTDQSVFERAVRLRQIALQAAQASILEDRIVRTSKLPKHYIFHIHGKKEEILYMDLRSTEIFRVDSDTDVMTEEQLARHWEAFEQLSQRILVSLAAAMNLEIESLDVSGAFLKGLSFDQVRKKLRERGIISPRRLVAIIPPANVWRQLAKVDKTFDIPESQMGEYLLGCNKPVYGLNDAPLAWRLCLHDFVEELGGQQSVFDENMFFWKKDGQISTILTTHVDDIAVATTSETLELYHQKFTKKFGKVTREKMPFQHCGMVYEKVAQGYRIQQYDFTSSLKMTEIENDKDEERALRQAMDQESQCDLFTTSGLLLEEFLQLQEREARHSSVMEEQEQRQVATRVELDRLRQEVSTTSTKLAHLSDLQNCLNEEQVRSIVKEGLEKAKAQMQECLQPFSPLERRLEQLAAEVSRHQTLAARAREELGGLLRAEMQDVAMDAALRQRSLMDSEVRSLLELQRRQFTEALEAAASRASCQLKDISTTHATEVRALASRLTDAERFAQQVGFAVHEMQKHRVKALQNGHPKTAPMDEMLLQQLQKEMQSFVCFSETKTRELQEALVELKATSCEHAVQLQSLASEADKSWSQAIVYSVFVMGTGYEELHETTKVRDGGSEGPPQWTEAMKGMETLTDIVGSLEREGPSSPTVAAVRHELQGELQQVWKVLRQMEARCSATGDAKQTKAKAQVTPKAHPRAKDELKTSAATPRFRAASGPDKVRAQPNDALPSVAACGLAKQWSD
eukprot:g2304.t1